ncbi:LysR family transcriptional regulator [Paraburkholderia sediminicola]|uniref:LysR family transcriptional regulator n=1 Tax=Paraburkholderia sediminicola TaxID=458836 RepID=UPI0038BB92EB
MNFRHLRFLIGLGEELKLSRAVESCHVAQPALSRQISLLEQRLGVRLFDRSGWALRLTEAGLYFRAEACQILSGDERAPRRWQADGCIDRIFAGSVRKLHVDARLNLSVIHGDGGSVATRIFRMPRPHTLRPHSAFAPAYCRDRIEEFLIATEPFNQGGAIPEYGAGKLPFISLIHMHDSPGTRQALYSIEYSEMSEA